MIRYLRLSLRYPALFLNRHSYGDLLTYLTLHLGPTSRLQGGWACLKFLTSSDDHEDGGNKEQRSPGGENQASNHCPTQRSVLLAAFATGADRKSTRLNSS